MRIIRKENYLIIPLAYNIFCKDIYSLAEGNRGIKDSISIMRILSQDELRDVIALINKDFASTESSDFLYVIDLCNIISCENRMFERLRSLSANISIALINCGEVIKEKIEEDISEYYIQKDNTFFSSQKAFDIYAEHKEKIDTVYHDECVNIVKKITQNVQKSEIEQLNPLDSSGVYCNMYVNAKKLFLVPQLYYFIIYQMICMIETDKIEVDAFISASRNGANIANIIGWLMGKKVIHCANIGPKFSLASPNISGNIRKSHSYIYIFDFMCLGTEVKVLNALLGLKEAKLVCGYGIANYINCNYYDMQYNVLGRIRTLVDVQAEKFNYKITGTKDELEKLLREDNWKNESGLQNI